MRWVLQIRFTRVYTMNIVFREARPEDAIRAADLIYSAGPAAIGYAFSTKKHRPIDFIRWAFRDGSGVLGFRNHTVAVVDGRTAGIGAFYNAAAFDRLGRMMVWQIIRFYGVFKCPGVLKRTARLEAVTPRPGQDALFIQNLGVASGAGCVKIRFGRPALRNSGAAYWMSRPTIQAQGNSMKGWAFVWFRGKTGRFKTVRCMCRTTSEWN